MTTTIDRTWQKLPIHWVIRLGRTLSMVSEKHNVVYVIQEHNVCLFVRLFVNWITQILLVGSLRKKKLRRWGLGPIWISLHFENDPDHHLDTKISKIQIFPFTYYLAVIKIMYALVWGICSPSGLVINSVYKSLLTCLFLILKNTWSDSYLCPSYEFN